MRSISDFIQNRWSPRAFADKLVDNEDLKYLFTAAGRAPSSNNDQPWRFIVGNAGSKTYDLIYETLVDFNQEWVKTAPVLAIGIIKKISDKTGEENKHASYDTGAAVALLTAAAFERDIFVHQMAGFDAGQCDALFNIPSEFTTIVAFAIGYIGDKSQLHEKIAAMENGVSSRKDLEEIVFEDDWQKPMKW